MFTNWKKIIIGILFLCIILTGVPVFSQTTTHTREFDEDLTEVTESTFAFRIFRTDPGNPNNNVHQVVLELDPMTAQGSNLNFRLYVPGSTGIDINEANTPHIDGIPAYTTETGGTDDDGFDITLRKVAAQNKWELDIRFKPNEIDVFPNNIGVIGIGNHTDTVQLFILKAYNFDISPDPLDSNKKKITATVKSRTRTEYNASGAFGTTGVDLETPPDVTISLPTGDPFCEQINVPADLPRAINFTIQVTNQDYSDDVADTTGIYSDTANLGNYSYTVNGTATPFTPADMLNFTESISFNPEGYYKVKFTIKETLLGTVTQETTKILKLVIKYPPTAIITVNAPLTTPAYGDAPLSVDVSAAVTHNDPLVEGDGDYDANDTDYTFEWEFETGSTDTTDIENALHTYTETGEKTVTLTLTDDYGLTGEVTETIYATPLDKINFPSTWALPGEEQLPVIDGVIVPTDTDDDGTLEGNGDDVIEMGWTNSFRVTFASGTDDPVAFQCLRPSDTVTNPYLYLSFEVNNDFVFDADDVIVLTFRPDSSDSTTTGNDRRIFVFPVYDNRGAGDVSPETRAFNQNRRDIQFYFDSSNWTPIGLNITEAATEADDGFFTRVHSFQAGTNNYSWHVEMRVPLSTFEGGTNWINLTNNFLFYVNVIRVDNRALDPGIAGHGTQFYWPRDAVQITGSLAATDNLPVWTWGGATRDSGFGDCTGVYINSHSDIGIWESGTGNILNQVNIDSSPFIIPMVARVYNNSDVEAENVSVLFRVARWGATLLQEGNWVEIPEGDPLLVTYPDNPTDPSSVPAATGPLTPGTEEFFLDWRLIDTDPFYIYFDTVQDHQCVYAEIYTSHTNILRKSCWNNITFAVSSEYNDVARISTVGCGLPPDGKEKHRIILEVSTREWVGERKDDKIAEEREEMSSMEDLPSDNIKKQAERKAQTDEEPNSYMEYFVYASYDTGETLTINENVYRMFEPIASFGYVFHHEGEVKKWIHSIEGAKKIAEGLYVIEIEPESYLDVKPKIESVEPPRWSGSLHAGCPIPLPAFSDDYYPGFSIITDVGYEFVPQFKLFGLFGFHYFFAKDSSVDNTFWMNVSVNPRYYFLNKKRISAYIGAGPGLYIPLDDDLRFGFNVGAGIDIVLNSLFTLEIGVDYHYIVGKNYHFETNQVGLIFNF